MSQKWIKEELLPLLKIPYCLKLVIVYDKKRVCRVSGLRREPVFSVKNHTLIPHPTEKRWYWPYRSIFRPSRCEFCAGFLCTELTSLGSKSATTGSGIIFLSGMWARGDHFGVLHGDYRFHTYSRDPAYHVIYIYSYINKSCFGNNCHLRLPARSPFHFGRNLVHIFLGGGAAIL